MSAGSQEAIRNYRARMGWADWPWYTTADDFSADFDVSEWFGINVFLRDGDQIYRSYYTTSRGAEDLSSVWALLDITPFGRQEEWQDAPEGVPQDRTGSWTRRHDKYSPEELAGGRDEHLTLQRMEHVGIVVDDLAAATEFFAELGLVLRGEAPPSKVLCSSAARRESSSS